MKYFLITLFALLSFGAYSQTPNRQPDNNWKGSATFGTNSDTWVATDPSAALQVGESGTSKGLLLPRVTDTSSVSSPAFGLVVFNITDSTFYIYKGKWVVIGSGNANIDTVSTVSKMQSYVGNAQMIFVTDTTRGGLFYWSKSGVNNNGTVFTATGKGSGVWNRQIINGEFYITWFGASSATVLSDNSPSIQATINAASSYNSTNTEIGTTVIVNQPAAGPYGYGILSTITIPNNINFICNGQLFFYGKDTAIVVNSPTTTASYHTYRIFVNTLSGYANWADTSVGVVFNNINYSNIYLVVGGFGQDVICRGVNSGFVYNNVYINRLYDFHKGISLLASGSGWVNENNYYGGEFQISSSVGGSPFDSMDSYAVYINGSSANNNRFWGPSFEIGQSTKVDTARYIPLYIDNGTQNFVTYARMENTSTTAMQVNLGKNNYFIPSYYSPGNSNDPLYSANLDYSTDQTNSVSFPSLVGRNQYFITYNSGLLSSRTYKYGDSTSGIRGMFWINTTTGATSINSGAPLVIDSDGIKLNSLPNRPFVNVNTAFAKRFLVYQDINYGDVAYLYIQALNSRGSIINPVKVNCILSANKTSSDSTTFGSGAVQLYQSLNNPVSFTVSDTVSSIRIILTTADSVRLKSFSVYSTNYQIGSEYSKSDTLDNIYGISNKTPTDTASSGTWYKNDFSGSDTSTVFWYRRNGNWFNYNPNNFILNNSTGSPQTANIFISGYVRSTAFTSIAINNPLYRFQPPNHYSAWQITLNGVPPYDGSNTGATYILQRITDDSLTHNVMSISRSSGAIHTYDSLVVDSAASMLTATIRQNADTNAILVSQDKTGRANWVSQDSLLNWNIPETISYPSQFPFRPFNLFSEGNQVIPSTDIISKINSAKNTLTAYYVDPINGNDSNTGLSWAQAFKTPNKVISGNYQLAYLKGGWYNKNQFGKASNTASYITKDTLFLIGDGEVHLTAYEPNDSLSWTAYSTYSWYALVDSVGTVVDYRTMGTDGLPTRYKLASSYSQLTSTPAMWFASNDTLYVHTANNLIPDSLIKVSTASYKLFDFINANDTGLVYFDNISFEGQQVSFTTSHASTIVSKFNSVLNNCTFAFSPSAQSYDQAYGLYANSMQSVYTYNCTAYKNDGDGFHYENTTVAAGQHSNILEMGDRGFDNGNFDLNFSATDVVNGSSVHDSCYILRINSSAWKNRGPNFSDISAGSLSMYVNCSAFNSTATDSTRNSDFDVSQHPMWLNKCISWGSLYGAYTLGHGTGLAGSVIIYNSKLLNGAKTN